VFRAFFSLVMLSLSAPALAGHPYFGLDAGSGKVRSNDVDQAVKYSSTPPAPGDVQALYYDDAHAARWDHAVDVDLVAGFDFGWFRAEGELAQKRAGIDHIAKDDIGDQFLSEVNARLNRPSQAPDPGAPGLPALTIDDFQTTGTARVRSAMLNVFLDIPVVKRFNVYAGFGAGRSFAHGFGGNDHALAQQQMLGARYAVTSRIDLGIKYRKFNSGIIKLQHDPIAYSGNPRAIAGGASAFQTTNAAIAADLEGEFRTQAWLLSLRYNLR